MLRVFRRRRLRGVVAALALMCVEACYAYVPLAQNAAPATGERVRVSLTPQGASEMTRYLGPNVVAAEGVLTETRADTLVVAVDFVRLFNGTQQQWAGEGVVLFPAQYRSDVATRVFQKRRSLVAGSALALALVTTAVIALRAAGASGGGEQPPPPPP